MKPRLLLLILGLALLLTALTTPRPRPVPAPPPTVRLMPCGDRYGGSYITGAGRVEWCVKGHRFTGY
jgi:hypothetical protein